MTGCLYESNIRLIRKSPVQDERVGKQEPRLFIHADPHHYIVRYVPVCKYALLYVCIAVARLIPGQPALGPRALSPKSRHQQKGAWAS